MLKRIFDIVFSLIGLVLFSPIIMFFLVLVYLQDFKSPLYIADRIGYLGTPFKMVKIRSMVHNADKSGVDSTSVDDNRITIIGKIIRKIKLDEISQLWNVLIGDMSFVGPRPNVKRDVDLYTDAEYCLLDVLPGITDYSSIIFSDEGSILAGSKDPDLDYNQLIRPWKSRFGLFYIDNHNLFIDLFLIFITIVAIFSKPLALKVLHWLLKITNAPENLLQISLRNTILIPYPPPGSNEIVKKRI